jgi:hypothetical protein
MTATATTGIEKVGSRLYAVGAPFALKDALKRIGCHWDSERRQWWIGTAKQAELEQVIVQASAPVDPAAPKPKQDPHDIRLTGKGRYKGREYFAGSITRDGQKVRLLTLPDANGEFLDFWAFCSEVEQTKSYKPREHTFRSHTTTQYTTLGSIADFVADQRQAKAAGVPQCPVCGKRNDNMVRDLETGMDCCRGCADMPSDEY